MMGQLSACVQGKLYYRGNGVCNFTLFFPNIFHHKNIYRQKMKHVNKASVKNYHNEHVHGIALTWPPDKSVKLNYYFFLFLNQNICCGYSMRRFF